MKTKIDFNDYMLTDFNGTTGLLVGTYAKYAEGRIDGIWLDMEKFEDAEEFFDVCHAYHSDEEMPEFMFMDKTGIPDDVYDEMMDEEDINKIIEFAQLDKKEKEMLADYWEEFCGEGDIDDARNACFGKYDSFMDFAATVAEERMDEYDAMCENEYDCKGAKPIAKFLRDFFDYEKFADSLEIDGYRYSRHGYVFFNA